MHQMNLSSKAFHYVLHNTDWSKENEDADIQNRDHVLEVRRDTMKEPEAKLSKIKQEVETEGRNRSVKIFTEQN